MAENSYRIARIGDEFGRSTAPAFAIAGADTITTSDLAVTTSPRAQDVKEISEEDLISLKSLVLNAA